MRVREILVGVEKATAQDTGFTMMNDREAVYMNEEFSSDFVVGLASGGKVHGIFGW